MSEHPSGVPAFVNAPWWSPCILCRRPTKRLTTWMPGEADLRVAGLDRGGERVAALVRLCEKCAGRPGWSARVRNAIARDRQSLTITEVDGRPEKKDGDA